MVPVDVHRTDDRSDIGRDESSIDGRLDVVSDSATRLLRLLSLLQTRPRWTGAELAERLEITERTLRRDIERLRALEYPVSAVRGASGGYCLGPGGALPPLLLDEDEAVAVAVSLRTAANASVTGIEDTAISALLKLEQVLPTRLFRRVTALHEATASLPGWPNTADADVLTTVAAAYRDRVRVRLTYTDYHGTPSTRVIEPHRLVHTGRRWYVVARDVDRDAWRTLRADRIGDLQITGVRFVHQDPPNAIEFVAAAITTAPYQYRARILFHAPASVVRDRIASSVCVIEPAGEGENKCILMTGSDSLDAIAMYLGLLDLTFTVLEPPELRIRIQALAQRFQEAL